MKKIDENYYNAIITEIRDKNTKSDCLKKLLFILGQKVGQEIIGDFFTTDCSVVTPLDYPFSGLRIFDSNRVIVSTKDDYEYFAKGLSMTMDGVLRGYMDFNGVRGREALTQPVRSIEFPELARGQVVDCLIIAKAVLATGCTAISLAKKAIEYYNPQRIIIATVFYSLEGINAILRDISTAQIYVFGEPDKINEKGMAYPGFGDIDQRLKA